MKAITAYLAAAGITGDATGPATTALQAMLTDAQSEIGTATSETQTARAQVQTEIRENQQARALAGAFRKVAEKAGVDLAQLSDTGLSTERRKELSDTFTQQVLDFVTGASGEAQDATRILQDAGFDLDGYRKAGKDKRAELARGFVEGITGDRASLRAGAREKALGELKLDAKKAGKILGDVTLEKGKVTVKGADGNPVEVETWGVKGSDGTFTPVEKLVADAGWTMGELAPRADAGTGLTTDKSAAEQSLGWMLGNGQAQGSSQSGGVLDFLTPTTDSSKA